MYRTARETQQQTLTRLIRAWDARRAVTITALKEAKDEAGKRTGALVETVRTVEIYDVAVSAAGDILVRGMDRETQESRTFRLDRLIAYTVHRSGYTVERTEDDTTARTVPSLRLALATVAGLDVVPIDTDARVAQLADALAA